MYASHKVTDTAILAGVAMAAVPRAADALPELPDPFGGRDRDNVADDLVAGDARV